MRCLARNIHQSAARTYLLSEFEGRCDHFHLGTTRARLRGRSAGGSQLLGRHRSEHAVLETGGEVRQSIAVIKKRSGPHEKTLREFKAETCRGLRIGKPIKEFDGVLTGLPFFRGTSSEMMPGSDAKK